MKIPFSIMTLRNVFLHSVLTAIFFSLSTSFLAAQDSPLLSQQMVEPYGLTRAWFNQVDIDPARSKILHAIVEDGTMFVVSDDAKLHALNAETGQSLWVRTLGNREMMFQEPAVNSRMVIVLNGLEMFVFDRRNGKQLQRVPLPGAASTACDVSENYVYIPMMDSRIIAYPLVDVDGPALEEEGGAGAEQAAPGGTMEETEEAAASGGSSEHEDPVLANIVKQFAKAKESVMAEPAPQAKEKSIVLRPALGIPMTSLSFGTVMVKPTVSSQIVIFNQRNRINVHRETVTWVTDRGFLLAASINSLSKEAFDLQYMIDSSSQTYYLGAERIARREWDSDKELGTQPTVNQCIPAFYSDNKPEASEIPSMIVIGGKAAYVFAVKDRLGEVAWQFAASGPIRERIAIVGTDVYCCTSTGGMHNLNLMDGKEKWYSPDLRQFIAASKKRVYALDRRDRVVILDRETGAQLNSFDARRFDRFLFNIQTDRIYVINQSGLIQCLHERQPQTLESLLAEKKNPPVYHRLTCKEYADVLIGKPAPELYWQQDAQTDADSDDGESDESPKKNATGEDGSLDGDEMDIDIKPKRRAAPAADDKEKEDNDSDPFG